MQKAAFDPGLTNQFTAPLRRGINRDGTFNVRRIGASWRDIHPYLHLVNMSWAKFFATLLSGYFVVNLLFAVVYWWVGGAAELKGAEAPTEWGRFLNVFFFSAQTLTTVGYGGIHPNGVGANVVSTLESMTGVLGFAVATGLLFGRFSKPSARFAFSNNALIAPYQDGTALEVRVVNRRPNLIMELEAQLMLMTVIRTNGDLKRSFEILTLERPSVLFFPLTWTVVHPIDTSSPLYGKTVEDLELLQAEVMVLLKGYDETFGQTVRTRYSYRYEEIRFGARFAPAFEVAEQGDIELYIDRVSDVTHTATP
jgi:inward rectifier potassium channel